MKKKKLTKPFPCSTCEKMRETNLITREVTMTMKGVEISFTEQVYQCTICGSEHESGKMLDKNLKAGRKAYHKAMR